MKDSLRQQLKQQRTQLSTKEVFTESQKIVQQVAQSDVFKRANKIGVYHSVRGEADPSELQTPDKQFYLPVLSKDTSEGLVFLEIDSDTVFTDNKFAIPEPVYDESKVVSGTALDLVIVPLLGFDVSGHRLGMGGGFYDRCFAFKKQGICTPTLMGFAYDFQELDSIDTEHWDVDLDMVATQSRLIGA